MTPIYLCNTHFTKVLKEHNREFYPDEYKNLTHEDIE